MEHVRNPFGVAVSLLICVAVGVTYLWFTVRSRGKYTPPWWCLLIYTMGTLVCTFGQYHITQTVPLEARPSEVESWVTTLGLGAVITGFLLWAMRVPLPRDPARLEITHEGVVQLGRGSSLVAEVRWDDLREVWIQVSGLAYFTDARIVIIGTHGRFTVDGDTFGVAELMGRLRQLPGFDGEAYNRGIDFCEDGRFCVWQRKQDPSG